MPAGSGRRRRTDPPPEDRWTFVVAPYLWAISLDGNAEVKGVEADVDVPFSDALKDLSFGAMLLVDARRGRFGIAANGVFTRVSPEDDVGPIEIDVTSDLAQLGIGPYYRALEWQYRESASGRPLRLVLEPWVGARLNHLRVELDLSPGRQFDDSQTWVDPVIGTRFALDLADHWLIAGEADIGGVVAARICPGTSRATSATARACSASRPRSRSATARCTSTTTTTTSNGTSPSKARSSARRCGSSRPRMKQEGSMAQVGIRTTPSRYLAIGLTLFGCWGTAHAQSAGTLPSWRDGAAKAAILEFVEAVTAEGGPDFVPPEERVAVFDNDGTLWVEQPDYTQLAFALDRIRALAPEHPEWREQQPFKAVLENDLEALKAAGIEGVVELVDGEPCGHDHRRVRRDRRRLARDRTRIPRFKRPYTELVYQPMLELLDVSAGERLQDLHRLGRRHRVHAALDRAGLRHPARAGGRLQHQDRVRAAGTACRCCCARRRSTSSTTRRASRSASTSSSAGGRSPPSATPTATCRCCNGPPPAPAARLGLIVHHDDAEREYAYDRDSHIGRLDQALDDAGPAGWVVVSMKDDWQTVSAAAGP